MKDPLVSSPTRHRDLGMDLSSCWFLVWNSPPAVSSLMLACSSHMSSHLTYSYLLCVQRSACVCAHYDRSHYRGLWAICGFWELNSWPLEEQAVSSPQQSLFSWSHFILFSSWFIDELKAAHLAIKGFQNKNVIRCHKPRKFFQHYSVVNQDFVCLNNTKLLTFCPVISGLARWLSR